MGNPSTSTQPSCVPENLPPPGPGGSGGGGTPPPPPPTTPPPPQALPTGLLVPLYIYPSPGAWNPLIATKASAPTVPIIAVVNPSNGPGSTTDPNYTAGIQALRNAGILVYAYVHTSYASRPIQDVINDIVVWNQLYPGGLFSGLFVDEVNSGASTVAYYSQITAFAKQSSFGTVIDNPGADINQALLGAADVFVIYEGSGLPSLAFLDGWHQTYARGTWAFLAKNIFSIDSSFLASASQLVGLMYMTADGLYQAFPSYLTQLAQALA